MWGGLLYGRAIGDVHLRVVQPFQVGAWLLRVVGRPGTGAPDVHVSAMRAQALGNPVPDPTGSAHDEGRLAAEIESVHS